ncbi:MAG TPA: carboxypeptidase-like regulatory domain-containing protein, partial [Mucilaginibacter sp.]|nr:carboxypeptidase-like regulatory domain-containing protein [Mucilaginibacter sp.]
MHRIWIILFLALPFSGFSQYTISGRIINKNDQKPVADASVFLNGATVGTKTADNGTYTLTNVRPGQYDLVVSIIGFETVQQNIMVNKDIQLADIYISPKTIVLNEVKIRPNGNRERDYQTFLRLFFGNSEFAPDCKILNPDLLDFDFDSSTLVFSASSSDFLEIENNALGYKIRYLLTSLTSDSKTGINFFEGQAVFEELKGSKAQQRGWQKNRLKVYLGSSMHFLRSAISDNITDEGFRVLRLIRKLNPDSHGSIRSKYKETLVANPYLSVNDFLKRTNVPGQYALGFDDCLYVLYAKKWAHKAIKEKPVSQASSPAVFDDPDGTKVIFEEAYVFFDANGIIINPQSILFDGKWGTSAMAELLPVDYVPV